MSWVCPGDKQAVEEQLPCAVGTRHSCSISVTLVLLHKGFITGPVKGEDAREKVVNNKPPLDVPPVEVQVLRRVVAQEMKPSR